jgi:hypothetical protein
MTTLLLVHGGLWEAGMDAGRFWGQPGIVAGPEKRGLPMPVGVVPSALANAFHQRHSVDSLLTLVPGAVELPGCPESPRPEFPPYLESFVNAVAAFAEP